MNYYESLLESYDLLKKRKFKLSIYEGESKVREDPAREAAAKAAGDFLGRATAEGQTENEVTATLKDGGLVTVSGPNFRGTFRKSGDTWVDGKGKYLEGADPRSTPGRLVGAFMGEGDDEVEDEESVEDEELEDFQEIDSRIYPAIIDAASILGNLITTKEDYGELAKEIEEQLNAINENTQAANAELERAQARGERLDEEPIDVAAMFEGVKDVAETAAAVNSDPSLGDPESSEGIAFSQKISDLIIKYNISIDEDGLVRFGTTSLGITSESNFGKLISTSIQKLNKVQEDNQEVLGVASTAVEARAPLLENADRGVAGENFDILSPYFEKCTTQEKGGEYDERECNKLFNMLTSEVVSTTKERESFLDSALVTFAQGDQALAEELFTGETGRMHAARMKYTREFLKLKFMEEQGLTEEQATQRTEEFLDLLKEKSAAKGKDPKAALRIFFISLIVNREFGENLHGIATPTSSEGAGQGQAKKSNVIGAKVDVLDKYSKEEYKTSDEIKEQIRDNLLSDQQKDYYEDGCSDSMDSILDGVVGDAGKEYEVERELKIHGKEGKSAWGQTSHGKRKEVWDQLCGRDAEGLEPTEKDAINNVRDMMHNGGCLSEPAEEGKKAENEAKFEKSCKFNDGIQEEISEMTAAFDLDNPRGVEGTTGSEAVETAINVWTDEDGTANVWTDEESEWFKRKRVGQEKKAEKRRDLAKEYARRKTSNNLPDPKNEEDVKLFNEQKEAFDKIKGEIENAIISKHLDKHTSDDGYLEEPALGYAQAQYAVTVQGLKETLNDKRVLEDNTQFTMLRNAEARANIRSGEFRRSKGKTVSGDKAWSATINIFGRDQYDLSDLDDLVDDDEYEKMPDKTKEDKKIKETQKQRRELKKQLEKAKTAEERKKLYAEYPLAAPKDKKSRATVNAERTNSVVRSGTSKAVGRQISKKPWDESKESATSKTESSDLFKEFLRGQQNLLEVLLNQTT